MDKITAVLINYNDEKYIKHCFDSLLSQTYSNLDIVIIDNNSADNSMRIVESDYVPHGRVKTIYNNCNKGFGDACNIGADYAFANGAEFVLFINTDTESQPNLVEELVKYSQNGTVVTTAKTYRDKECKELWYSGGFIDFETALCNQTFFPETETQPQVVDFASGCCMFISKNIWNKIGGFDEDYFLYYEDTDYCLKLKENNVSIIYVPTTYLWHKVGGSEGGEVSPVSQYYTVRNRLLFAKKHNSLMKVELMDILSRILKELAFFESVLGQEYKIYYERAIYDFFDEKFGKENNLFHSGCIFGSDFYRTEEADGNRWQWCGQKEGVVKVANSSGKDSIVEIAVALISAFEGQRVGIYWNGEYRETFEIPLYIHSQCFIPAGGVAELKFVADIVPECGINERRIVFGVQSFNVKHFPFHGVVAKRGFYQIEEADGNHWQWCGQKAAVVEVANIDNVNRLIEVCFCVIPLLEDQGGNIEIFCGQDLLLKTPIDGKEKKISMLMPANSKQELILKYDGQFITLYNGDERTLGYMLQNPRTKWQ